MRSWRCVRSRRSRESPSCLSNVRGSSRELCGTSTAAHRARVNRCSSSRVHPTDDAGEGHCPGTEDDDDALLLIGTNPRGASSPVGSGVLLTRVSSRLINLFSSESYRVIVRRLCGGCGGDDGGGDSHRVCNPDTTRRMHPSCPRLALFFLFFFFFHIRKRAVRLVFLSRQSRRSNKQRGFRV